MVWPKSGETIKVPKDDAVFLAENSPSDFEIILPKYELEEPIQEIEKEEEDQGKEELEIDLSCPYEGCDFVAKKPHGLEMHINRKHKTITPVIEPT